MTRIETLLCHYNQICSGRGELVECLRGWKVKSQSGASSLKLQFSIELMSGCWFCFPEKLRFCFDVTAQNGTLMHCLLARRPGHVSGRTPKGKREPTLTALGGRYGEMMEDDFL